MARDKAIHHQAFGRPLAILESKLTAVNGVLYRHYHGQPIDQLSIEVLAEKETLPPFYLVDSFTRERLAVDAPRDPQTQARYIAVLPLFGLLVQHAGAMTDYSGGTALADWVGEFRRLVADPAVGWIVIETNSPGGSVYFVEETADEIFAARQSGTRIIQVANSMAASAAVWIGTAAHEVVVTPGGEYGSIGVISQYVDESAFEQAQGIKTTFVRTPAGKARFTGMEPLDEAMLATMTKRNEEAYARFVKSVARNRGVTAKVVKEQFGQGEMMSPEEAKSAGLIDRVASLQAVLDDLVSGKRKKAAAGVRSARNRLALEAA